MSGWRIKKLYVRFAEEPHKISAKRQKIRMIEAFQNQAFCCSWEELLPVIPSNSIQLIFTSPPYEDMKVYRDAKKRKAQKNRTGQGFVDYYWNHFFDLISRPLCNDGVVCIVINDKRRNGVISPTNFFGVTAVLGKGWHLIEHVPYMKSKGSPGCTTNLQDWWEHIYCFARTRHYKEYPKLSAHEQPQH